MADDRWGVPRSNIAFSRLPPMRGWERARPPYRGNGAAGDYLEQLRKERMQTTFLITIDSPHMTLETMRALLDLNDAEGISVEAYSRPRVQHTDEDARELPLVDNTFSSSNPSDIRHYLDKAILSDTEVEITYRSYDQNVTTRRAVPLRWRGGLLTVQVPGGIRSFTETGIERVEGPAL